MDTLLAAFYKLTPSEQAAWLQAVGGLIAIGIAIAIPLIQAFINHRLGAKRNKARAKVLALSILPALYKLRASASHYMDDEIWKGDSVIREIDELKGDYFHHAGYFNQLISAAPDYGEFTDTLSKLVFKLFAATELLSVVTRLQAGGQHQAYTSNRGEFLIFAAEINSLATNLINMIERAYKA